MAKNLYEVVQNLLIPFLMLAMVSSINCSFSNKRVKTWHWNSVVIVFVLTVLLSVLRQWRFIKYNQINNVYLLCAAFFTGLAYIVFVWLYSCKRGEGKEKPGTKLVFEIVMEVMGLVYVTCLMLYKVPVVIFLPLQFLGIGESVFTTMYLLKTAGFICGWLVCALFCAAFYKLMKAHSEKSRAAAISVFYLLSAFIYFVAVVGIINSYYRKRFKLPAGLRKAIPRLISAENVVLLVTIALLAIIALVFIARHIKLHGEYENPAEKRLLLRHERDCRRLGAFVLALSVFAMVDMTAIKKRSAKLVELSPSEDFQIEGKRIFIPLEQVSDGHLHRFSWDNGRGKTVRFIIVQKKGTNFGIGFDACEVCGNVGYYERKNDVVCNRCDVVMNRNTIGLKGGCNPIPLRSSIEDGGIVVDTDDLNRESGRF